MYALQSCLLLICVSALPPRYLQRTTSRRSQTSGHASWRQAAF